MGLQVVSVHQPISGARNNFSNLPLPPIDHARSTSSCLAPTGGAVQAAPVAGSWEGTVIKHMGTAQSVWQWQQLGGYAPRGARATTGGVLSVSFSVVPSEWLGLQVIFVQVSLVAVHHAHLWSQR